MAVRLHPLILACPVLSLSLMATPADAGTSTIGRVWPIVEPDALTEIEGRSTRQPDDMSAAFGPRAGWSAMRAASLGITREDRTRTVVPFYTMPDELRLPDGKLLYPNGFTFNPLSYVSLPQRLIIVRPKDLDWALTQAAPTDFILLAAGSAKDADALTLSDRHARALFILEERVKKRLGLTVAPVIVRQLGQKLELTEIVVDPKPSPRKLP